MINTLENRIDFSSRISNSGSFFSASGSPGAETENYSDIAGEIRTPGPKSQLLASFFFGQRWNCLPARSACLSVDLAG